MNKSYKKQKKLKFFSIIAFAIVSLIVFIVAVALFFYVQILPRLVSNPCVIDFVQKSVKQNLGADLVIKNINLETSLKPKIRINIGLLTLKKDNASLINIENLDNITSFENIFKHNIELKKLGANNIFIDVNKVMNLTFKEQKAPEKSDWTVEWLNSLLYIKKCKILYTTPKKVAITVDAKNLEITEFRKPKMVHFDINVNIKRDDINLNLKLVDKNSVYMKNKRLFINNFKFLVNKSTVKVNSMARDDKHFGIRVASDDFDIKSVVNFLNSDLLIPDGSSFLTFFKDIKGNFSFYFDVNDKNINGIMKLKNGSFILIPLSDLPITAQSGQIRINKKEILLEDFKGYYGKSKLNKAELQGNITDYTKSVKTEVKIKGIATNYLASKHISKIIGYPISIVGDAKTFIKINSIYDKIDIKAFSTIDKNEDILIDGLSISEKGYQRALSGDFHMEKNIFKINKINYYVAEKMSREHKVPPVVVLNGTLDIIKMKVNDFGFVIPNPLPSEFLNVLLGQSVFKKGMISGNLKYVNTKKIPIIDGNMSLKNVRIPSQRLSIKKGELKTDNNLVYINAQGKFRRSNYDFKGFIKNEMLFPVVIKDVDLTVENLDINKMLKSLARQKEKEAERLAKEGQNAPQIDLKNVDDENSDDESYTFNPNILVIEKSSLNVKKGIYKEINFGNLHADMTLNKNGIFEVKSNKFDFAEGISSCKVYCDLKKHTYSIRLGAKNVNSDLIASNLLDLKKEISGKASALMEFYSDDSLKLNGKIQFIVENGSITKLGLIQYILKVAALFRNPIVMISPSTLIDLVNVPEGTFKNIIGFLNIKDNVIERINIKSSSPQLSSFIVGKINLETKDSALRIYTKFSDKNKGFSGFLRNFSLNALSNKIPLSMKNEINIHAAEINMLPKLEINDEEAQVFVTTVDGDIETNNFLSSLKRIK